MAVDPKKVRYELDLTKISDFNELNKKAKEKAKKQVGDFVKESILENVGEGRSPVANGQWKKSLSPAYKKIKSKTSSVSYSNMELTGGMLDSLKYLPTSAGIEIGVYDKDEVPKAFRHNTGDDAPTRRFIPLDGEKFRLDINREVKQIVKDIYQNKKNRTKEEDNGKG